MKLGKYSIYFFICFFFNLSQSFSETISSIKIEDLKDLPSTYEEIEEFVEEISGLKVLDNLSLQFYLYQVYYKNPIKNKESFDDFFRILATLILLAICGEASFLL